MNARNALQLWLSLLLAITGCGDSGGEPNGSADGGAGSGASNIGGSGG